MTQVLWPSPVRFYADKHWPGKNQFTKRLEQVSREICRLRENVHRRNNDSVLVLDDRLGRQLRKLSDKQDPTADHNEKPVQNSVKPYHDEIQLSGHHRNDLKTKCIHSIAIQNGDSEQDCNHLGRNLRSARSDTPSAMTISARRPIHQTDEPVETTTETTTTLVVFQPQHHDAPGLKISESADRKTAQQTRPTVRRSERRLQRRASSALSADCEPSSVHNAALEKRPKLAQVRRSARSNVSRRRDPNSCTPISDLEVDASDATTVSYVSNDAGHLHLIHASSVHRSAADILAVPSWRIVQVPKRYVIEGTENLTDEAYLKRHQRLENDEKRRKRWDLQRQRELSMYEHLRRDDPADQSGSAAVSTDDVSLSVPHTPDADSVAFVEVVDNIPTCAFGHLIPDIIVREFELPWKFGVNRRINKRINRQVDRHVDRQVDCHGDRQVDCHGDRQVDCHGDRQVYRHVDRQVDQQVDCHGDRQVEPRRRRKRRRQVGVITVRRKVKRR